MPFGQRVRRPRKNGLRLIAIFNMADDTKRDQDREIQRMEREESHSNWIYKFEDIDQMTWLCVLYGKMYEG